MTDRTIQLMGVQPDTSTLFHGTSERFLKTILSDGLRPRGTADGDGNWDDFPSRPDMVYLTTAYPLYFAQCAAEGGERLLIVETRLDSLMESLIHPDEDVVSQSIARHEGIPLREAHQVVIDNLEVYQHAWESALNAMGNVAYQGAIPANDLTRYALVDLEKLNPFLSMAMLDPSITPLNYMIKGAWYRHFTSWCFGDEPELPHLVELRSIAASMEAAGQPSTQNEKQLELLAAASIDRSAIEVFNLNS